MKHPDEMNEKHERIDNSGLISLIIPIYQVEEYLPACIESLLEQTYKNIEIILVDDGSPDQCPVICDEYANRDCRIKVIHKQNGGLSDARNMGLDSASGEYIMFIDSDDLIESHMVEILYRTIKQYDSEMVICRFVEFADGEHPQYSDELVVNQYSGEESISNLYNELYIWTVPAWNKIYKRELFEKERYMYGRLHEDEFIIHRLLGQCHSVTYISSALYGYRKRSGSIMNKISKKRYEDRMAALENRIAYCHEKNYYKAYYQTMMRYMTDLVRIFYKLGNTESEIRFKAQVKDKFLRSYSDYRKVCNYARKNKYHINHQFIRNCGIKFQKVRFGMIK